MFAFDRLQFVVDHHLLSGHRLQKLFKGQHAILVDVELVEKHLNKKDCTCTCIQNDLNIKVKLNRKSLVKP